MKKTADASYLRKALSIVEKQIEWAEKCALAGLTATHCAYRHIDKSVPNLKWTANKTDLIELLYALNNARCLNHGNVSLNRIATFLGEAFSVNLSNFPRDFYEMRTRNDQTPFLDKIIRLLKKRMDDPKKSFIGR